MCCLKGELFVDQITGDVSKYDYYNKFISLGEVDHDVAEDFSSFLNDLDHRWLKVIALFWSYRVSTKLLFSTLKEE